LYCTGRLACVRSVQQYMCVVRSTGMFCISDRKKEMSFVRQAWFAQVRKTGKREGSFRELSAADIYFNSRTTVEIIEYSNHCHGRICKERLAEVSANKWL
jgi:hypothetical protein